MMYCKYGLQMSYENFYSKHNILDKFLSCAATTSDGKQNKTEIGKRKKNRGFFCFVIFFFLFQFVFLVSLCFVPHTSIKKSYLCLRLFFSFLLEGIGAIVYSVFENFRQHIRNRMKNKICFISG